MYMIDNAKKVMEAWKEQYSKASEVDEKAVMILITALTLLFTLAFFVAITWLVITFIKMVWPFLLVGAVIFIVFKVKKKDSE